MQFVTPCTTLGNYPPVLSPGLPYYVVMMPYHLERFEDQQAPILEQMRKVRQQAFAPHPQAEQLAQQRIWIILGLNCRNFIGKQEQVVAYVNQLAQQVLGLNVTFVGFVWNGEKTPFQEIREAVKNTALTSGIDTFAQTLWQTQNPVYLVPLDADFIQLDGGGTGAFTALDQHINSPNPPHLVTLGYSTNIQDPKVSLGIALDQDLRREMARELPAAPYYSEVFFASRMMGPIRTYSFISKRGDGFRLESLGWIENGIANGQLDSSRFVYGGPGGVVTPITRLLRGSAIQNERVPFRVELPLLRALRSIGQTHLHPIEWADRILFTIPVKDTVAEKKGHLAHIFNTFDPIYLMETFPMPCLWRNFLPGYSFWRTHYPAYVAQLRLAFYDQQALDQHATVFANSVCNGNPHIQTGGVGFFKLQIGRLTEAQSYLSYKGNPHYLPTMSPWIDKVLSTAMRCGLLIFNKLNQVHAQTAP